MDRTLPVHPITGSRALGFSRSGAPIWPVRGGDGTDLVTPFLALDEEGRTTHLASLSGEDLAELMTALEGHFADLDAQPATAAIVAAQESTVGAIRACRGENTTRLAAEQDAEARRTALREEIAAGDPAPTDANTDAPAEDDAAGTDGDAGPVDQTTDDAATQQPEAVAAAAASRAPARRP
ncbi:MAG: hypothetical protein JWP11_3661, partial [Frankiales bacterium]|nr:hypothetical protein [Frankiales bacterium]